MEKELHQNDFKALHFNSKDGLLITADFYSVEQPKGLILLCHRSHCNRGEYRETAPKLNKYGFHGSKTLWESVKGHETFWKPLDRFFLKILR